MIQLAKCKSELFVLMVFFAFISKVTLLLSMLLPIKVILLLGSDNMPSYLPSYFQNIQRDQFIIYLTISAFVSYFVYLGSVKLQSHTNNKFLKNMPYKKNTGNRNVNLHKRRRNIVFGFIDSIASLLFFIFAGFIVSLVYSNLILLVFFYLFFLIVIIGLISGLRNKTKTLLADSHARKTIVQVISNIGFFAAFIFIVFDFIKPFEPPGLIYAVIGLILCRQLLVHLSLFILKSLKYFEQRMVISSFVTSEPK